MTEDNGDHLFVPIATKWLASRTDDDDDDYDDDDDDDDDDIMMMMMMMMMMMIMMMMNLLQYSMVSRSARLQRLISSHQNDMKIE